MSAYFKGVFSFETPFLFMALFYNESAMNQEIAKIFNNIAFYLEMDGVAFKPQAYEKAALILETLPEDVRDIYKKRGSEALEEISGIGKSIASHIVEYLKTGRIKEYEQLKNKIPVTIDELVQVEGLGPKKIKVLYQKLKIRNIVDLEKAAKVGKIRNIPQFGLKTEQNILESIKFLKRSKGRFLLGEILPIAENIANRLKELKEVKKISFAGSVRRMKETIGDIDILIVSDNPKKIIDYFTNFSDVIKILGKGPTKASVRLSDARLSAGQGFDVDLRVLPQKSLGSALQYFTGSKEHNIVLRKIAIEKGLKLNEYGLFKREKMIAGKNEEEIYKKLGLQWIPPELRENQGEIETALENKLPKLVEQKDILGDLHVHSNWNGGENSIEELAKPAIEKGYEYIGISDHTKFLKIENGLDEKQLEKRNKEIDKINKIFHDSGLIFNILRGCEANIMPDGSIDINDKALAKLDYVIAGVHHQMKMTKKEMTERIIKAMRNKHVDIISHPTGRILKKRDEYEIDFDKILQVAKETGTILEINASPHRLDLKDFNIKKAKEAGVKMIINTDAHYKDQLDLMKYGVSQARRGWAEKKDIINCWPVEKLLKMLK